MREMWRFRNILHNFLGFTWRLLLSLFRPYAKLTPGNATCGGSAGPAPRQPATPGRAPVLKGTGGGQTTEAAPPERPPLLRERVVQSCGRTLRRKRVLRAESGGPHGWANPGGTVGLFGAARRQRFGGPAGGRADPVGSPGTVGRRGRKTGPSQDGVAGSARVSGFPGFRECRPQGWDFRRCKGLRTRSRRLQAVAKEARTVAAGGQKPSEASGSCPARARLASDLGPARLTSLLFWRLVFWRD